MSSIIKSFSVVDDRGSRDHLEALMAAERGMAVIKGRAAGAAGISRNTPRDKDSYLDQLNRIRVEEANAEKELRAILSKVEDARAQVEELEELRAELQKMEGLSIETEAIRIIQDAERDAEEILDKARQECQGIVESMKAQGYLDGLDQGANEARAQIQQENQPGIEALGAMKEALGGLRDQMVAENEAEMIELILTIAERVIGRQIKDDPQIVVDMLRDVMEQNRRVEYIKVLVSKDLMPAEAKVSEQVKKIIETLGQQVDVVVESEGRTGGLVVETPGGYADLSVDTQMQNIRETIQNTTQER